MDDDVWSVAFHALASKERCEARGGGMIGKTSSVLDALGIDHEMSIKELRSALAPAAGDEPYPVDPPGFVPDVTINIGPVFEAPAAGDVEGET